MRYVNRVSPGASVARPASVGGAASDVVAGACISTRRCLEETLETITETRAVLLGILLAWKVYLAQLAASAISVFFFSSACTTSLRTSHGYATANLLHRRPSFPSLAHH